MSRVDEMDLRDYLRVLRRRRRPLLLGLFGTIALAAIVAALMPRTYRSTAVLYVERQVVPEQWISGTTPGFFGERLHALDQRVMSAANLEAIASKYPVFPPGWKDDSNWVGEMRDAITAEKVNMEVSDPLRGRVTMVPVAVNVSFDAKTPEVAQQVAQELAKLYLRESEATQQAQAAAVVKFLTQESSRLAAQVGEVERKLSSFKSENLNSLPELVGTNRSMYDRSLMELTQTREAISSLEQRRAGLTTRLAGTPAEAEVYGEDGRRVSTSKADRLRLLRTQYAQALQVFTEDYPDVIRLKQEIEALEAAIRRDGSDDADRASAPTNAAYIALQSELGSLDAELQAQRAKLAQLERAAESYEERLMAAPHVEREYQTMLRQRDSLNAKYSQISGRLLEAQMAAKLEGEQAGDHLYLVQPANLPSKPKNPTPMALMFLGVVLGVGSGVGGAAFSEYWDRGVRGRAGVRSVMKASPLIVMPYVENRREVTRRRHKRLGVVALAIAVLLVVPLLYLYLQAMGSAAMTSVASEWMQSLAQGWSTVADAGGQQQGR